MDSSPFATVPDVEGRWRPLSAAQAVVAENLLDDASDMIRNRWPDIDSRLESESISAGTLRRITVAMVRRALLNQGQEGVESFQQSAGVFATGAKFANPTGNLYLSGDEIRALTPNGYGSTARSGWLV